MGLISNGTTIFDAGALDSGIDTGITVLIKTVTASDDATIQFVDGSSSVVMDSTYKHYIFHWQNIRPATDSADFGVQFNAAGGSGFNETITSTCMRPYSTEGNASAVNFAYKTAGDLGQATSRQFINFSVGGGSAECCNGRLMIFEPSNTAIVKNFMSDGCMHTGSNEAENDIVGGFINTTSAIDEINFAFSAGNITSGSISMYGVK